MTFGGNKFNDFLKNHITKFRAEFANFYQT